MRSIPLASISLLISLSSHAKKSVCVVGGGGVLHVNQFFYNINFRKFSRVTHCII